MQLNQAQRLWHAPPHHRSLMRVAIFASKSSKIEECVVVNEKNEVVGFAPRKELVRNRMLGRGSYTLVFDSEERLFVSKRSESKDVWPGRWDTVISGVVNAGEEYTECALRELSEELGLSEEQATTSLVQNLGTFRWQDPYCDVWGCAFVARLKSEGQSAGQQLALQQEEVECGQFMPLAQVEDMLTKESFTPVGRHVLEMYLENKKSASGTSMTTDVRSCKN